MKSVRRDRDTHFSHWQSMSNIPGGGEVRPLTTIPIRTLSKDTLEAIVAAATLNDADKRRDDGQNTSTHLNEANEMAAATINAQNSSDKFMNSLPNLNNNISIVGGNRGGIATPIGISGSNTIFGEYNASTLLRNDSIDVTAVIAALNSRRKTKEPGDFQTPLSDYQNAQLAHSAAHAELQAAQAAHIGAKISHAELQKQADLKALAVNETVFRVKQAEEKTKQAVSTLRRLGSTYELMGAPNIIPPSALSIEGLNWHLNNRGNEVADDGQASATPNANISNISQRVDIAKSRSKLITAEINKYATSPLKSDLKSNVPFAPLAKVLNTSKTEIPKKFGSSGTKAASEHKDIQKPNIAVVGGVSTKPKLVCVNCGRINTPQWRIGPAGPKTLCNACGVHYRKFKTLPKFQVSYARVNEKAEKKQAINMT